MRISDSVCRLLKRICQILITFSVKTEMAILKDKLSWVSKEMRLSCVCRSCSNITTVVFVSWFCSNWSSVSIPNVAESRPLADPIFLGRSTETLLAGLEERASGHNQFRTPSKLVFDDCIR